MKTLSLMVFAFFVTMISQPARAEVDEECMNVAMKGTLYAQAIVELMKASETLTARYAIDPSMETDATLNLFITILQKARSAGNGIKELEPKVAECLSKMNQKQNGPK